MDPVQQPSIDKTRRSADMLKAELERKKRDLYKVYNPTNQDFQVVLNAAISPEVWTIQAHEESIVPNYVRVKYLEEMTDKIIINKSDKAVIEENRKREEKGFAKMDLHTEQYRFESRNLKNLMSKRDQVVKILDRGLYKEYGIERAKNVQEVDRREQRDTFDPGLNLDMSPSQPVSVTHATVNEPVNGPISPQEESSTNSVSDAVKVEEIADE